MTHIAYYTELNYAQKRRIFCENSKHAPDENFCGHFCPRRKAANFCHPASVGINQPCAVCSARNMLFFTISAVLIGFFLCSECKKPTNELPVRIDLLCLITQKSSNINVSYSALHTRLTPSCLWLTPHLPD